MTTVGLQTQIWRNNLKSTLLLIGFPSLILSLLWLFFFILDYPENNFPSINYQFFQVMPWISGGVFFWFIIAYFSHSKLINKATSATPLARKENPEIYNLVENLCISVGIKTPKINIIEDTSLNAFASGINEKTYCISLSRGIIEKLNKEELEGVIAHELSHIRNKDVRLLIISIIFVGIFAFLSEFLLRSLVYSSNSNRKKDGRIVIVGIVLAAIGYLLSVFFKLALSRKREYLADAGAVQLTKKPLALASALKKVSEDSRIEAVQRKDVAQLFIDNPQEKKSSFFSKIFSTHPPIKERIQILEQF